MWEEVTIVRGEARAVRGGQSVGLGRKHTSKKRRKRGRSCLALTRPDAEVYIHRARVETEQVYAS